MAVTRTLATFVARDRTSGQIEVVQVFIPFLPSQTEQLNQYVANFCVERNLEIFLNVGFTGWVARILRVNDRLPPGEFDCVVCGQACLQNGIDLETLQTEERFCSNFCSEVGDGQENS